MKLHISHRIRLALLAIAMAFVPCQESFCQSWIPESQESKPYTRWWWLGSAVDKSNLLYNLSEYSKAGIGGVEITPIYGVKGNDANDIPYLSSRWMEMLKCTEHLGDSLGIEIDMATGTGWPFGGPQVTLSESACKAIIQTYDIVGGNLTGAYMNSQPIENSNLLSFNKLDISCQDKKQQDVAMLDKVIAYKIKDGKSGMKRYQSRIDLTSSVVGGKLNLKPTSKGHWVIAALYVGRTKQQVKRAAPGGEGLVIDHFSKTSLEHYLSRFDEAFTSSSMLHPHTYFNDSYEVYGADWTPSLLDEFAKRRGYKLEDYLPDFVSATPDDFSRRLLSDYRETMGELLLENFTRSWTSWAHRHGSITRNQAHGSPANLIDVYAAVDIPECEGFGLSDFGIKGLRQDPGFTKKNFSDISMLKYASSGAHISGKQYTSSETFTWLTEHFRTSLSQCKPDLDLMFISGVNHVFFHGSCYSPREAEWPGWRFYASVDMSPNNSYWNSMPAFSKYISRCQSFLQWGEPDNDFLVYLPYYDMIYNQDGRIVMFDIHSMEKRAPEFIKSIQTIVKEGYDVDYISDNYLQQSTVKDGKITTTGNNRYSAVIVPDVRFMPQETLSKLISLASSGANIVFVGQLPEGTPGMSGLEKAKAKEYGILLKKLSSDFNATTEQSYGTGKIIYSGSYRDALSHCGVRPELMRKEQGLQCIRRSNPDGHHYFISNLQGRDIDGWVDLGIKCVSAVLYDPMTGNIGSARMERGNEGNARVYLQLKSGESVILRTYDSTPAENFASWAYYEADESRAIDINTGWTLSFTESAPQVTTSEFNIGTVKPWTSLDDAECNVTMGTGKYSVTVNLPEASKCQDWMLDLGDVRESAKVTVNGHDCGTLFSVPFQTRIGKWLKDGNNEIEILVTNLPANRISKMDREGVEWRKFKEINVVDLNYKKDTYSNWETVPSGLNSKVRLIPLIAKP